MRRTEIPSASNIEVIWATRLRICVLETSAITRTKGFWQFATYELEVVNTRATLFESHGSRAAHSQRVSLSCTRISELAVTYSSTKRTTSNRAMRTRSICIIINHKRRSTRSLGARTWGVNVRQSPLADAIPGRLSPGGPSWRCARQCRAVLEEGRRPESFARRHTSGAPGGCFGQRCGLQEGAGLKHYHQRPWVVDREAHRRREERSHRQPWEADQEEEHTDQVGAGHIGSEGGCQEEGQVGHCIGRSGGDPGEDQEELHRDYGKVEAALAKFGDRSCCCCCRGSNGREGEEVDWDT